MLNNHGTYHYKDKQAKAYILILDGRRVGQTTSKKEAEAWFRTNVSHD